MEYEAAIRAYIKFNNKFFKNKMTLEQMQSLPSTTARAHAFIGFFLLPFFSECIKESKSDVTVIEKIIANKMTYLIITIIIVRQFLYHVHGPAPTGQLTSISFDGLNSMLKSIICIANVNVSKMNFNILFDHIFIWRDGCMSYWGNFTVYFFKEAGTAVGFGAIACALMAFVIMMPFLFFISFLPRFILQWIVNISGIIVMNWVGAILLILAIGAYPMAICIKIISDLFKAFGLS